MKKKTLLLLFVLAAGCGLAGYCAGLGHLPAFLSPTLASTAQAETPSQAPAVRVVAAPAEPAAEAEEPKPQAAAVVVDAGPLGCFRTLPGLFALPGNALPEAGAGAPAAPSEGGPAPVGLEAFFRGQVRPYVVRPGQNLSRIAKDLSISYELLMRINGMHNTQLLAGQTLRVVKGPFHVKVDCSERKLYLLHESGVLKAYPVAVGPGTLTPRGRYTVQSKMVNPDWTNPETRAIVPFGHPENPLGTRWIAFTPGYGIHGTNEPESIGTASSKGCIRMMNEDVEELHAFLRYEVSVVDITD